jgi:4-diphosphocytidyl-2-C-methyl-D-erythritol kinase
MLTLLAPAKINLCLHVGGRREDGLHELQSLAAPLPVGDEITVSSATEISLEIVGSFASDLDDVDVTTNLAWRAAVMLQQAAGINEGAKITLTKNMPVASGIGAGSADAATTLFLLRKLWSADISDDALLDLSFKLGADGPLCLLPHLQPCRSVIVSGAGEHVRAGPDLPPVHMCLINPGVSVSTGRIFELFDSEDLLGALDIPDYELAKGMPHFINATRNDLQVPAQRICPEITEVLALMNAGRHCLAARMSGSGATCFGFYENKTAADDITKQALARGWWAISAVL